MTRYDLELEGRALGVDFDTATEALIWAFDRGLYSARWVAVFRWVAP